MSGAAQQSSWAELFGQGRLPRFLLICFAVWMNAADSLVTATIMPSVGKDLGGYQYFSWAVAGFLVGSIVAGSSAGRLSETLGLRRATVLSGLAFALGCLMSALAPDMGMFLAGRFMQGVGSGWVSGLAMVAIAFLFPEHLLSRVFGSMAAIWGVATVLGPLLGGIAAELGNWRLVFWLFTGQALLFAIAAFALLRKGIVPQSGQGVPWRQLALLLSAIACLGLAELTGDGLSILIVATIGTGLLALFLRFDARAAISLLPRRASDLRTLEGRGYGAIFALTSASMGFLIFGPALLQRLLDLSPIEAGYSVAAHAMAWSASAMWVAGRPRSAMNTWIRTGSLLILAGPILLAITMPMGPLPAIMASAATMGAGFGLSSALINQRIIVSLSDADRAVGSSALNATRQVGEVIGAVIAGAAANLTGFGAGQTMAQLQTTAGWVFAAAIPLAALGTVLAWGMARLPTAPSDVPVPAT